MLDIYVQYRLEQNLAQLTHLLSKKIGPQTIDYPG